MIRILIDSGSEYLPKEAQAKGIEVLPIVTNVGGNDYRDGFDLGRDEFFELLEETGQFPTTSQITPHVFAAKFKEALDAGDEVIAIILSSALSGTYQNACMAQAMVGNEGVYVIDSLTATYPISILADYAATLRDEGMPAAQIVEAIEELKGTAKVIAMVDTLEYLQRGGRIPKAAAKIGEAAKLKPVISVTEKGDLAMISACLGRKRAFDTIMKQLESIEIDDRFPVYAIYSYGTKNCERLEVRLQEAGISVTERRQIGYVIGSHIGPNACGVVYVEKAPKKGGIKAFFKK
ncbi:MAG: DegV family protein [Eggerthellaceae bacterium]|nr:DegV family protein [Eggerthellaceae bacterium]MEE0343530.1 DegV family protein [Eggerthellaceae bacterium]CCY06135.1 eDD domain protein DegV family [Eggerthella sp. CAG:1427]